MWRIIIFKWQPSKLLWIWIFGAVTKVRTTEKNFYLGRLLWSCLKPPASFAEREKTLYWACNCSWLLVIYSFMSDKQAAVIYRQVASKSWPIMKKQHLSSFVVAWISSDYFESLLLPQLLRGENDSKQSDEFQATFVAGQDTLVPCIFMCFSIIFQTSSCGYFFLCVFFFDEIAFSSILRNELKRFAWGA